MPKSAKTDKHARKAAKRDAGAPPMGVGAADPKAQADERRAPATPTTHPPASPRGDTGAQVPAIEMEAPLVGTTRPTSAGAEAILHARFDVLDHGFVRLVDYMGDDRSIPQAARVSYGSGTKRVSDDTGLIRYLMRHWHTTPFEMVQAKFHVKVPVFIARQWMRHRAATYNEYSARYSILDREFYLPSPEDLATQSTVNKQGRAEILDATTADRVLHMLRHDATQAFDSYDQMVDPEGDNLARELARINLPMNTYTQFYWSVSLHNLLHFLRLRADSHAQAEIRAYAETISEHIVAPWCPISHQAFADFRRDAVTLSRQGRDYVNACLAAPAGRPRPAPEDFGIPKREAREILASFPGLA